MVFVKPVYYVKIKRLKHDGPNVLLRHPTRGRMAPPKIDTLALAAVLKTFKHKESLHIVISPVEFGIYLCPTESRALPVVRR